MSFEMESTLEIDSTRSHGDNSSVENQEEPPIKKLKMGDASVGDGIPNGLSLDHSPRLNGFEDEDCEAVSIIGGSINAEAPQSVSQNSLDAQDTDETQPYSCEVDNKDWDRYFDKEVKESIRENGSQGRDFDSSDEADQVGIPVAPETCDDCTVHNDSERVTQTLEECTVVGSQEACDQTKGSFTSRSSAPSTSKNTSVKRVVSIQRDAENIASCLNVTDVDLIYQRLKEIRMWPNRVDVVTNEILESGMGVLRQMVNKKLEEIREQEETDEIFADLDRVVSTVQERYPGWELDHNEVYTLLEAKGDCGDRVEEVIEEVIRNKSQHGTHQEEEDEAMIKDVEEVMQKFPKVDPNEVYELLTERMDKPNRVSLVQHLLAIKARREGSDEDRQTNLSMDLANDPLYRDTEVIASMFPDRDRNEIYAYLEAHHDRTNRIEVVAEELLRIQQGSQEESGQRSGQPSGADKPTPAGQGTAAILGEIANEVDMLKAIFPDCDPDYLFGRLEKMADIPDRADKLSQEMFEQRQYPRLKERLETQKKAATRQQLQTLSLNIDEFLQMFPDPEVYFYDEEKQVTENYRSHARVQLLNDFTLLHAKYIDKKLDEHKGHFLTTLRELEKTTAKYARDVTRGRQHNRFRKTPRTELEKLPDNPEELFYKEKLYSIHEQKIKDHIQMKEDDKAARLEAAKANNELHECGCCYDDEVLFEDMLACPEGHIFCNECIKRSAEEVIGQGKFTFPCLGTDCDREFAMAALQEVLSAKTFSIVLRKIQEEELQQAGIEDLISCPFCNFATIMSDPNDKVFKCLNSDCLKESCRLCKEPNHVPLHCEEVEKQGETDMRQFIENRVTEAMIRTCWRCKKRFYKLEGCNKMTCACGASMCYVCRKPIKNYDHFGRGGCPQDTNVSKLHQQEMEKAAKEARDRYEKEHPDAANKVLTYDPLNLIKNNKGKKSKAVAEGFGFLADGTVPFPGVPLANYTNLAVGVDEEAVANDYPIGFEEEEEEEDSENEYDDEEDEDEYDDEEYEEEEPGEEEFERAVQQFEQQR